jgi:hypothetical protein
MDSCAAALADGERMTRLERYRVTMSPGLTIGRHGTRQRTVTIILRSRRPKLSNNIIQKGLAFGRDSSGTVVNSGRQGRSEILPRRPDGRGGASAVRRDAAIDRTEDLDVKVCEEAISCVIGRACS